MIEHEKKKILILEDDRDCVHMYDFLLSETYDMFIVSTLQELNEKLEDKSMVKSTLAPDLLIADLNLSDGSFTDFLRKDGKKLGSTPVIIVSVCEDLSTLRFCLNSDKVHDYLTKPFNKIELLAKVEKFLPHVAPGYNMLKIDPVKQIITSDNGAQVSLTSKQIQIVNAIFHAPNHEIEKKKLLLKVWNNCNVGSKTLDVHLCQIRKKLSKYGCNLEIYFNAPYTYGIRRLTEKNEVVIEA